MSGQHGSKAVLAALAANLGIAASKFVGWTITGSGSMLAEGVHSVVDSGNQVLLLVGGRRAGRVADERHPFGYGQDRFFYAFVVSVVLFTLGSAFALYEGAHKVISPHHVDSPVVALVILGAAIGLESLSFRTAMGEARHLRGDATWWQFIRRTTNPELPVVLLEDTAALVGLVLAFGGVGAAAATGNGVWDGVGTLGIGVLLGVVASVLAVEMKSLLIGEGADPELVAVIRAELVSDELPRVIHLRTMYLGPDEVLVAAKVAVVPTLPLASVAAAIDAAEQRVRAALPIARTIYLEPDVDRAVTSSTADGASGEAGGPVGVEGGSDDGV